ncbi:pyridoxamine 5'-phosphate oxidase family protein [Geotalea uraniireducens]|uniref:Pyridoxamine 5'-phosphate oxidase-related, FMN-binding protein n=1 Tax=Geotalea uraniireducens (strain Rf4) TaxID=351605 RepID=A5G7A1_GEOUR|nr:pyridoxamine 5'-phosphate oxidase family protein [Geotalea uraniireducens]ABQ27669.1 pyridoxamine 5'-phosphate oxidase-related, FMN-binding protein [Geotalea uraniireducens Rf4]
MKEVVDFLMKSQIQYFATVGTDGKPKVRPFQLMMEEGGKLYFCTSNKKEVFKEVQKQPHVELCASGENFSWLRLKGKVVFSNELTLKAKVLEASPLVKSIYNSPDNPAFEVFYLADAVATIADFSGNPPRTYNL